MALSTRRSSALTFVGGLVVGTVAATLVSYRSAPPPRDPSIEMRLEQLAGEVGRLRSTLDRAILVTAAPPPPGGDGARGNGPRAASARPDGARVDSTHSDGTPGDGTPRGESASLRPPPSSEQRAALQAARALVDGAIARGELTRNDAAALREQMTAANQPEESRELMRALAAAVNAGRLPAESLRPLTP